MIKFSELPNCTKILCEGGIMSKEEFQDGLQELDELGMSGPGQDDKFYVAEEVEIPVNGKEMLERISQDIYHDFDMYEDWDEEFMKQVSDENIKKIEEILMEIIIRTPRCYQQGEEIEFD